MGGGAGGKSSGTDPVADQTANNLSAGELTYEQLQTLIERNLVEAGYYDIMSAKTRPAQQRRGSIPNSPGKAPSAGPPGSAGPGSSRSRSRSITG